MAAGASPMATQLAGFATYSYRCDPAVPLFPDDNPVIVYDGVCILCSGSIKTIARRDVGGTFRFVTGQSVLGQALFRHYALNPTDFETVLLIDRGRAYGKLDMIGRVAAVLGGPWRLFTVLAILPSWARDWCYDRVARNRYRLFGRTDVCMMPDASWRARVIE